LAQVRPFAAIRYSAALSGRLSDLVAPPYDVLDEAGKAALQKKNSHNIVGIDLPYLPPKTVGPDSAYIAANQTLKQWMSEGVLVRDVQPALYAYAQTYHHGAKTYNRRGFFGLVRLSPFGEGEVVPHEQTYPSAIADRLKLTKFTGVQLSPIFGLFSDLGNSVTGTVFAGLKEPAAVATMERVKNELWAVTDPEVHKAVAETMALTPIYIADGHHRYTMALQYQKEQAELHGGVLPAEHAANFVLFVMVAMQDPGLLILPTHRILGGLKGFDPAVLRVRLGGNASLTELAVSSDGVDEYVEQVLPFRPAHTFGLYDGKTQKLFELRILNSDVLKTLEAGHSNAWRSLDVAILQRYLLDETIAPAFAANGEITKSYTANPHEVAPMTDGVNRQVALLLKPTPLGALEALGRHNEVMPPKSTYFFPKLATGMVLNPVGNSLG
jgi:uncharacterized protein (DUF1015 family)